MEYIILGLDVLVLFIFFNKLINNIQPMRMRGSLKSLVTVLVIWTLARILGMDMTVAVFGTMMGYVVLLVVILFPEEFRKMLDRYGRKKSIFRSPEKLLGLEERREVAEAMMEMSRRRIGFLLVIAKDSDLDEFIENGDYLGEINVSKNMLMSLWGGERNYTQGAMIVKDNMILSANSQLPIGRRNDLMEAGAGKRHLAALGITYAEDCVALVVSGTTGKITIASKQGKDLNYHFALETREHNIRNGMDVDVLEKRISEALTGKEVKEGTNSKMSREEREKILKDKKEKKQKEKEERLKKAKERKESRGKGSRDKEREKVSKKRGKNKKETGPVSRGFGEYER